MGCHFLLHSLNDSKLLGLFYWISTLLLKLMNFQRAKILFADKQGGSLKSKHDMKSSDKDTSQVGPGP